jgi:DNA polymerase III subunit beta
MKVQVTQENLNKALSSVARVASSRNALPILSNVLLKTANNRLSLSATNLDIAITHYIGAKVNEEGSITVPAKLTQDFVNSLPGGVIDLELNDSKLKVTTDQYKSTVNGIVADDFPVMPAIEGGISWSLQSQSFKKALQQVIFAASSDESRPVLTGVYLHVTGGQLYMASTDSYRLAEKNLGANAQEISLLVPASAMQDLLRIIGDDAGDLEVTHNEQQVLFKVGDIELVARLVEGNYPPYRKLIPSDFTTQITLKRSELVNVTKVSSLFARESAGSVTLEIDEAAGTLSIRSIASQLGENTATAAGVAQGSGSITLNSRYLLDGLNAFSSDEITFGFNGKLEPTLLSDPKNPEYVHIVMPLKS